MLDAPPKRSFFSYLTVRLLLLMLLAVTPAMILTFGGAMNQRREARARAQAEVSRLAKLAAAEQGHLVEGARQFLAALADVPAVKEMRAEDADSLFAGLMTSFPVYKNIGLTKASGLIVASGLPMEQPILASDRSWFRRAMAARGFAIGDYQIGRITKQATVNFARPVFDKEGQIEGVLFVALGLDWLGNLAEQADLPQGAILRVTDANGTLLARHPDGAQWIGQRVADQALLRKERGQARGIVESRGADGVDRLYAFATLQSGSEGRILVSAGYSKDVLYAASNRTFLWAMGGLGVVSLLALLIAWLGGQWLVLRPVRRVVTVANRLRSGDLSARTAPSDRAGVVGELARALDEMSEAIQTRDRAQQEIEARIRKEQEFSSLLIESSMDGIVAVDREFHVIAWNAGMERITGMPRDQVVGRSPFELFAFMEQIGAKESIERSLAGETVATKDQAFTIAQTNRKGFFDGHYSPLRDANGDIVGGLTIVHETTERKRLEEQFRQAQKMESVGRLAGGVAHDFNNLLTAIMGYADLLRMHLPDQHPGIRDVAEIRRAAERAAELTKQLLAFSRNQAFDVKVVDLNQIIAESERMLRRMIGEDVELTTLFGTDFAHVKADAGQLHQVIVNLIVNARDAMPGGGKLTIETTRTRLDDEFTRSRLQIEPGEYVLMAVSDTGQGMSAETLDRIFEPFFTTKELGRGTGLGLSTVYGIVRQCGGHVDVYSEVGVGTTFKIYLPLATGALSVVPERHVGVLSSLRGSEEILLVEDDAQVRSVVSEALEQAGYRVHEARDAEEAMALAERRQGGFHLLITDVVMPRTAGPDLAADLLARYPELEVLFISGYMERAIVLHGILESNSDFLRKPFSPDDLLRKVREVLDRRKGATA